LPLPFSKAEVTDVTVNDKTDCRKNINMLYVFNEHEGNRRHMSSTGGYSTPG